MVDLKELWHSYLDAEVARTTEATGQQAEVWRIAGRPSKEKPDGENLDWWRADGLDQLQGYERWLNKTDLRFVSYDGTPAIELPFVIELAGITVRGFIDAVMVNPDGEVIVIDHKTGSRTPDSLLQLGLYATAMEVMGYPRPSLGSFWMTRKGSMTQPESLDRYSIDFYTQSFTLFDTAVANDIFIPNIGSHCRGCSVRTYCYATGGALAYRSDPLHPQYQKQDGTTTTKETT